MPELLTTKPFVLRWAKADWTEDILYYERRFYFLAEVMAAQDLFGLMDKLRDKCLGPGKAEPAV